MNKHIEIDEDEYRVIRQAVAYLVTYQYNALSERADQRKDILAYIQKIEKLEIKLSNIEAKQND